MEGNKILIEIEDKHYCLLNDCMMDKIKQTNNNVQQFTKNPLKLLLICELIVA